MPDRKPCDHAADGGEQETSEDGLEEDAGDDQIQGEVGQDGQDQQQDGDDEGCNGDTHTGGKPSAHKIIEITMGHEIVSDNLKLLLFPLFQSKKSASDKSRLAP